MHACIVHGYTCIMQCIGEFHVFDLCHADAKVLELGMFQRGNWLTIALQRLGICDALFEIP